MVSLFFSTPLGKDKATIIHPLCFDSFPATLSIFDGYGLFLFF